MLVVTRHTEETIIATAVNGDRIEIKVLGINGNRVRIGLTAPRSVAVVRGELEATFSQEKPVKK